MGRPDRAGYWVHAIARAPKEYLEGSGTLESRGPESWDPGDLRSGVSGIWRRWIDLRPWMLDLRI